MKLPEQLLYLFQLVALEGGCLIIYFKQMDRTHKLYTGIACIGARSRV